MTTDVRLTTGLTRTVFFNLIIDGVHFFLEKKWQKRGGKCFSSEIRVTRRQRRHSKRLQYTTGGIHSQTNTTDIQTVDSDCSKRIHQDIPEESKTKSTREWRDERVEKCVDRLAVWQSHVLLFFTTTHFTSLSLNMDVGVTDFGIYYNKSAHPISPQTSTCMSLVLHYLLTCTSPFDEFITVVMSRHDGVSRSTTLDGNPANRSTGHPIPVPC